MRIFSATLLGAAAAVLAWGASTATWELNTYEDFLPGKFEGVSLSRDGHLQLAPTTTTLFASEQPFVWSMIPDGKGGVYVGTGHRGRVYRVDASGKGELLWTALEPEIFALATDPQGVLYAATSPRGKIYRIQGSQGEEYFNPQSAYVWSLVFGKDGALYAGTGDQGRIYRITGKGEGKVFYETGQMHVTSLAFDREGRLLAGSEPNGILYRLTPDAKAFVLYDADLPEIRALFPSPDGSLYVAAIGGSVAQRMQAGQAGAAAAAGATLGTSINVTASTDSGDTIVPPGATTSPSAGATDSSAAAAPILGMEITGVEKSALFRIRPDNTVEKLWSSKEENLYDLLPRNGGILFSTDNKGRLYTLSADRKETLLTQTGGGEAIRLVELDGTVVVATTNMGRLLKLGRDPVRTGTFESPVHDAGRVARWGRISWQGTSCNGCGVKLRTRSGNTVRPDATWSDWSEPHDGSDSVAVKSPNARFLQWKAEITGMEVAGPTLDSVTVAYLPQNVAPVVDAVVVSSEAAAKPQQSHTQTSSNSPDVAFSVTVSASGETSSSSAGTPTTRITRPSAEKLRISWAASDENGDPLLYDIYFRGERERDWKPLKRRLEETSLALDSTAFADGAYYFRVVATDRPANLPFDAREAEKVSARVLIDHTPPQVTIESTRRDGKAVEVKVAVRDAASAVTRCEYSLNAGLWTLMQAEDGVVDSKEEGFTLRLEDVGEGEQLLVIRATDTSDNAGLARTILP